MSKSSGKNEHQVNKALRMACDRKVGVLDHTFLCQTVGVLNPPRPVCVAPAEPIQNIVDLFRNRTIGSVLVTEPSSGRLVGIFTERDCVRKALPNFGHYASQPVSTLMTPDPVAQPPDITVAFALNLMSQGGFRHLPLIDEASVPVGIISVKDMMDLIVGTFVEELLNFDPEQPESPV